MYNKKIYICIYIFLFLCILLYADAEEEFLSAAAKGDLDQLKLLLDAGVNIDGKDPFGRTALMLASMMGQVDTVKFLIEAGANIMSKNINNKSALDFAREAGDEEIVKLLEAEIERNRMMSEFELAFSVTPDTWIKGKMTEVTFVLKNITAYKRTIAKAIMYQQFVWFRFKVIDHQDNVIASGLEEIFIITDDLPELEIETLNPGESMEVSFMICLDKHSGFDNSYDLKPGKYKISGVYMFEPEKEADGAGLYQYEVKERNVRTGTIISKPVEVTILDNTDS